MSMSDLESALRLIDANAAIADFAGPKPEQLVKSAETTLGLTFPPTYRTFLNRLGAGGVGGAEFYGVIRDDFEHSGVPDAIWLTLKHRKTSNTPTSFVIVSETGDGGYYAIDASQTTATGESPVVEWWPGAPNAVANRRIVADDFGSFLLQRVQNAL
jgi:antitoxin YobK